MRAPAPTTAGRVLFGALGLFEVALGIWAEFWPARFYASFPGGGWHWVRASGAYDEHLLRDFGGLSLALAAVTLAVALRPQVRGAVVAALAWELYSVPHLAYHAGHLDALPGVQDVASIGSLALSVLVPVVAAALVWRGGDSVGGSRPDHVGHQTPDPVGVGEDVDLDDLALGDAEGHHH